MRLLRQHITFSILALSLTTTAFIGCGNDKRATPPGKKADPAEPSGGSGEFVPIKKDTPAKDVSKTAVFKGNGQFMPQPDDIKGQLTLIQGPDYYVKDTLFEQIDGASDGYIAYGFKELAKAVYKPTRKDFEEEVNAEIYSYNLKHGALGKFSEERSSCEKTDTFAANWCLRQSDLLFWKGPYMVKVLTFESGPAAEEMIVKVAKIIDGKLKDSAKLPEQFSKFPAEHKAEGTAGWRVRDLYGFSGLKGAFIQHYNPPGDAYKGEDNAVTLFTVDMGSPEEAKKLLASIEKTAGALKAVVAKGGVKKGKVEGAEDGALTYQDDQGTHTFFIKGAIIAGGRDFKDAETATMMTGKLAAGL